MSVSMLPEWKQVLLERKRREEEEREKRAQEEEERLASVPAWKRGIIQRRRAKQESGGEKARENVSEVGQEFEPETVLVRTTWKTYFICSQNGLTRQQRRKEIERGTDEGKTQRKSNYETMHEEEKETYNEREDNRGKWQNRGIQMERTKEGTKERESDAERGRKRGEEDDVLSPLISSHTIKAENIIIVEKRRNQTERAEEREIEERKKQGMKMEPKEFMAGGEKVTEICVSEVIIKPSIKEERSKEDMKKGDGDEKKTTLGVIEREGEETKCRRVSQLISQFGENRKPPYRSKTSDFFIPVEMGGQDVCRTGSVNSSRRGPTCSDWRKRQIEGEVEEEETREKERKEGGNEGPNESDRNSEISTFKGEMKSFREQDKQKRLTKRENMGGGTEKEMEEIQSERTDQEQQAEFQNESIKVVKHGQAVMVKFSDGEMESQSNKEERGRSITWNEREHHGGERLIPRCVFYGISEQSFSRKDRDEIRQVERRLGWKAGRPLARVESLRQRIWQKEKGGTEGGDQQAREAEMESRQEVASPQSLSQFDVTREVSKEELPVCVPPSLSAEQEPTFLTERHDGVIQAPETEKELEEDLLGEDYTHPSLSSSSSSSPSPPLSHTHPTMSRIYNLKPVTSRAGVCITERNLDVQPHSGGMIKIRPGGQFAAGPPKISTEISSLRSVQCQVEQLHLKEQEVHRKSDEEALQKQNTCDPCQDQNVNMQKSQMHTISKPSSEPRLQTQRPQISPSTTKSNNTQIEPTVTARATPLFTIRSASGGPGKKGTTITITPRKSSPSGMPSSPVTTPTKPSSPVTTPTKPSSPVTTPAKPSSSVSTPKAPSNTPELRKKRYPTVDEIEVIGGYQILERSCLVKNQRSSKMARVCFDSSRLECVYTYPSEESVVREEGSREDWRRTEEKKEEKDDEEENEDGVIGAGRGMNRVLRVDESCRR